VVRYVSTRVGVMYLGRIVEIGSRRALFGAPRHPYTQGLLRAAPRPDPGRRSDTVAIGGEPPSPLDPPPGCHFHTRCPIATDRCRAERPALVPVSADQSVACHHHETAAGRWTGQA
jgi:peptide/nickel transport system ATP-binding protein